jgi:hypothetical protein
MRSTKTWTVVFTLILFLGIAVDSSRADQWNKRSVLTFNQPVEIPGNKVLPAGSYVFKLAGTDAYRHIIQIWNEDETRLITTILAIPNYRLKPSDETVIRFSERPGQSTQALRAWFYPGDNFGHEFVYTRARAIQLAEASKEIVPAETAEPTESTLKTVPLVAITPEKKEEPVTEAIQVTPQKSEEVASAPQTPTAAPVAKAKEIPKTATAIPLIALLGLASVGLAVGLKLLLRQMS